jgi:hypothetical protein
MSLCGHSILTQQTFINLRCDTFRAIEGIHTSMKSGAWTGFFLKRIIKSAIKDSIKVVVRIQVVVLYSITCVGLSFKEGGYIISKLSLCYALTYENNVTKMRGVFPRFIPTIKTHGLFIYSL